VDGIGSSRSRDVAGVGRRSPAAASWSGHHQAGLPPSIPLPFLPASSGAESCPRCSDGHQQEPREHGRQPQPGAHRAWPPGSPRAILFRWVFVQEAGQRCGKDLGERWRVAGEGGTVPAARSIRERRRRVGGCVSNRC
jgi:hypothetical protein